MFETYVLIFLAAVILIGILALMAGIAFGGLFDEFFD